MEKCKITCSLDGKEASFTLYGAYGDPKNRTFASEEEAEPVATYLAKRSLGMLWNSVLPHYHIVPVYD